jgi:hypothetical protein
MSHPRSQLVVVLGMTTFFALSACASVPKTYSLATPGSVGGVATGESGGSETTGQLSVESTRSGQRVLVVQLTELPPPERIASGLTEFVVWIEDGRGRRVKAGTLRYDRARHAGNLLATTDLSAFTVQITGERSEDVSAPSDVLVAERRVSPN